MPDALDWDFSDLNAAFPGRAGLKGLKQNQFDLTEIFVRPLGDHLPALKALLLDEPADVFVSHTAFYGGGWLHELGGPPNATLGDTCLAYPSKDAAPYGMGLAPRSGWVGHLRNRAFDADRPRHRARSGDEGGARGPCRARSSPRADTGPRVRTFPVPAHPALSSRFRVPDGRIFLPTSTSSAPRCHRRRRSSIRRAGGQGSRSRTVWSSSRRGPSLPIRQISSLLVLRGSLTAMSSSSPRPVVPILLSSGMRQPNAVVERFVPYAALLPHVDVMVSNGGFGSVQLAIANGVPMVVAGTSEDKKEVTAHVGWSGTGINLRTDRPSPKAIAEAVERVLKRAEVPRAHRGVTSTDGRREPGRKTPPIFSKTWRSGNHSARRP